MSKYIIELDDTTKAVQKIVVFDDGRIYTHQWDVEDLEELNSDYINEHFGQLQDDAYKRGYKEGEENGRKDGLFEAWELMKKIVLAQDSHVMVDILGAMTFGEILLKNTPQEAIAKLKAYEEKQKADDEIKVGDEVIDTQSGTRFCVTHFWVNNHGEKGVSGFNHECSALQDTNDNVKKTGRHFDIKEILEEMKE